MILDAFDIGGTETHVLSLTKQLLKLGIPVFVAGKYGNLMGKFKSLNCKIYNEIDNMAKFEKWIKKNQINVIHTHLESSSKYASKLSNKLRIPLVYTFHGTYYDRSKIQKMIQELKIKPKLISVSQPVKKWLKDLNLSSILIPNGIDTIEFNKKKKTTLRSDLGIPKNSFVLLYVSRLEDEKYKICKLLLQGTKEQLLKEFPNLHLFVVGDGKRANEIKQWIRTKSKSVRIHFLGKRSDMPDLYTMSDCVVGTGRVALEAMACKRNVIAIGSEGIFGILNGKNLNKGWKYYFGDHRSNHPFSQKAISSLVSAALRSHQKLKKSAKDGRIFVKKQFNITRVVKQLQKVYEQCIV